MYSFEDRGSESLTYGLRPPPMCAGYVELKLHQQPGFVSSIVLARCSATYAPGRRFRQFYQIDVEAIGEASPVVDAEVLTMLMTFLRRLGLQHLGYT
jgi:histidyl-tRNA synthetase